MRVTINAGGRQVEIDCPDANTTYADVADKALQVWRSTDGTDSEGPAYGFTSERRYTAATEPILGHYGEGTMREVRA